MTIQWPGNVQRYGYRPGLVGARKEIVELVLRADDVGVDEHVVGPGDVVAGGGVGLGDDLVHQVADLGERAGLDQGPVVRHRRPG